MREATMRLGRVLTVGVVLALLALLVWDLIHTANGARFANSVDHGKRTVPPPFDLRVVIWNHTETWPPPLQKRIADQRLSLRELRGYPVVLNFWASWCVPCKEEAPAFRAVARHYAGRVAFVGIDTQDLVSAAHSFLTVKKVNYVSVADGTQKTYTSYGLTGVPETYYINRQGQAVGHAIGAVSKAQLTTSVDQILRRPS